MSLRITVSASGSTCVRIDRATRIEVDASGDVTIEFGDSFVDASISRGMRKRDKRGAIAADRRIEGATVTPAMEAAAVEAFLARADVSRLGRSLADVYAAMEAARLLERGLDDGI